MAAPDRPPALPAVALLGAVTGMRTFAAPAILARRGRWGRGRASRLLPLLAAGELIADKLPIMPSRSDPPSLLARLASATVVGARLAGAPGAAAAAAGAAATTRPSERLRAVLVQRLGLPDPVIALAEDVVVLVVACYLRPLRQTAESPPTDAGERGTQS